MPTSQLYFATSSTGSSPMSLYSTVYNVAPNPPYPTTVYDKDLSSRGEALSINTLRDEFTMSGFYLGYIQISCTTESINFTHSAQSGSITGVAITNRYKSHNYVGASGTVFYSDTFDSWISLTNNYTLGRVTVTVTQNPTNLTRHGTVFIRHPNNREQSGCLVTVTISQYGTPVTTTTTTTTTGKIMTIVR